MDASTESRRLPGDKPLGTGLVPMARTLQRSPGDCREINAPGLGNAAFPASASTESRRLPGDKRFNAEKQGKGGLLQRSPGDCREINPTGKTLLSMRPASTESRRLPGDKHSAGRQYLPRMNELQRSPGDCREINHSTPRPATGTKPGFNGVPAIAGR